MNTAVLSPSEGLIARHLTHWIKVATNGKGGSRDHLGRGWTYLAAWDIQERVAALDHVELSIPTIYRSLKALISKQWFVREKMNAGRYRDQTYHYTYGSNHPDQSNASDQGDQTDLIKTITSITKNPPVVPPSNSHKGKDIRPSTAQQQNSLNKEGLATPTQPLRSITDAAPTELLEELKSIEANYQRRKAELVDASDSGSTDEAEVTESVGANPTLSAPEHSAVGAPSVLVRQAEVDSKKEAETASGSHSGTGRAPAWHAGGQENQPNWLENGIHNPQVGKNALVARRAHNPKVGSEGSEARPALPQSGGQGRQRSAWDRIRALASQFDPASSSRVSPRAVITRDGLRLNVCDGATEPLR